MSHTGCGARLFAWFLAHVDRSQEKTYGGMKEALFAPISGDVLEIGPGTGINFRHYPRTVHVIGVEPNPYMRRHLESAAAERGIRLTVQQRGAETLDMADASVDAVVSTLVLCSVADPARVLAEARRVLRPHGALYFIEHVAAPKGTWLRRAQDLATPLWRRLGDGCRPNRESWRELEAAGFANVDYRREHLRKPMPLIAPHIIGRALK